MTTEGQKTEIAQKFLTGLRNRDWESLKSLMTEDIVWSLPGSSLISGEAQSSRREDMRDLNVLVRSRDAQRILCCHLNSDSRQDNGSLLGRFSREKGGE